MDILGATLTFIKLLSAYWRTACWDLACWELAKCRTAELNVLKLLLNCKTNVLPPVGFKTSYHQVTYLLNKAITEWYWPWDKPKPNLGHSLKTSFWSCNLRCAIPSCKLGCAVASWDVRVWTHFNWNLWCGCVQPKIELCNCSCVGAKNQLPLTVRCF